MNQVPWSLHLLAEVLSAFSVEDPEALRTMINRVAEAVDAEVVAIVGVHGVGPCIGVSPQDHAPLLACIDQRPESITVRAGQLQICWAPLDDGETLLVGRLAETFDLEERAIVRAMARSIELSKQIMKAVSSERMAREVAVHQAIHDPMTGLPNRTQVLEHLSRRLADENGKLGQTAVLFIDIDRFKQINDVHGHAVGDQFLIEASSVLRKVVRTGDLVGRLSGDEFVVIVAAGEPADALALAVRIIERIGHPLIANATNILHSASVGISFAMPEDTAETLIENADMAMYRAKELGRGCYAAYDESMRQLVQKRATTEVELRRALKAGEIQCHFQPIVCIADGRIRGVEALARWAHPIQGVLPPGEFIPVAEETGLILEIDAVVLRQACMAVAGWNQFSQDLPLSLSVNVSARTFVGADLVAQVSSILQDSGLGLESLYLEITETMLVEDIEATTEAVDRLKDLGVKLAIDDFGTGYSSLLYLKRFPVGILKIDRSFTVGLGADRENEVIVDAVIGIARSLGIEVIAEGVETEHQAAVLAGLGCSYAQGYLYGRPQDIEATQTLLAGQGFFLSSADPRPLQEKSRG